MPQSPANQDALLAQAAEALPVAFAIISLETNKVTYANAACAELTGQRTGDKALSSAHLDDRRLVAETVAASNLDEPGSFVCRLVLSSEGGERRVRIFYVITRDPTDQFDQVLCVFTDATKAIQKRAELEALVRLDALTGLLNRHSLTDELTRRLEASPSTREAVLFLDLDEFKDVNDGYGHKVGDLLLQEVAQRLRRSVRPTDVVGRLGGDEFVVITSNDTAGDDALGLARRIATDLTAPVVIGEIQIRPRVSVGVALRTSPTVTAEQLLVNADLAMYEAKNSSRSVAIADASTHRRVESRLTIERDLGLAMASNEITFHFQVIRNLVTNEPLGAEALVRWEHPTLGFINPLDLIKRVETVGQIEKFTAWSLDTVCRAWSQLREQHPLFHDKAVGFNLSLRQLSIPRYTNLHLNTVQKHGLRNADVVVEVTEYEAIHVGHLAESTIADLSAAGAPIALDDFGVGFSGLGYLTRMPVDIIKVDRSLVAAAMTSREAQTILRGVARMAEELGIETLGEGIETVEEAERCRNLGLNIGQGYLLGRPKPMDVFATSDALWTPADARLAGSATG